VPVEVKSGIANRAHSLVQYRSKFGPETSFLIVSTIDAQNAGYQPMNGQSGGIDFFITPLWVDYADYPGIRVLERSQ